MKRWRHFTVVVGIIPALVIYVATFMFIFEYVIGYFWLLDWFIYIIAGLLWLYPAVKVIEWLAEHEAL